MKNVRFTLEQVQQIVNNLLEFQGKHTFDTLLMIKQEVEKQQKEDQEEKVIPAN